MDENPYKSPETPPEIEPPSKWLVDLHWFGEDYKYFLPLFIATVGFVLLLILQSLFGIVKN